MGAGWRLLLSGPGDGAWNMSVDEALLEAGASPPTLRLYQFARPTFSLGYRQPPPAWLDRARSRGACVVRRISGGGTVLHAGDLTYAVAAPRRAGALPDGLRDSLCWLRERLIEAFRACGVAATAALGEEGAGRAELCFSAATGSEVVVDGAKLVGSAQRRTPFGLLQHGSVRLHDESALYRELTGLALPAPPKLPGLDRSELEHALVESFGSAVGEPLVRGALTPSEAVHARARQRARARQPLAAPAISARAF